METSGLAGLRRQFAQARAQVSRLQCRLRRSLDAARRSRAQARALQERVKELDCLHAISDIVETRSATLEEVLMRTAEAIPGALQVPRHACARVMLGRHRYATSNFGPSRVRLVVPFRVCKDLSGHVEARYLDGAARKFLPEERRLLKTVGDRIVDAVRLKDAERTLLSYQQQLRSLAAQLASTQERERRGVALYLHDTIGQSLVVARLKLKTDSRRAARSMDEVDRILEETIRDIRALTFEICPPVVYELGFEAALEWLVERIESDFGIRTVLKLPRAPLVLPEELRAVLFRAIRELLTNAAKHGHARSAAVVVRRQGRSIRITVEDDGAGFEVDRVRAASASSHGFGLFSIGEQMRSLGGRMQVDSSPSKGSRVHLTLSSAAVEEEG